jgi:hypothetical protein
MTAGWTFTSRTTTCNASSTATSVTARSATSPWPLASATTRTARPSPGWGTDFSDYDNDGLPDIVVTDLSEERYALFKNNGDGSFTEIINQSGLGAATLLYSGWSTRFVDVDNDGWKNLFVVQGHVMDNIEITTLNLKYLQPPLLLRNIGGRFSRVDAGPAFQRLWVGRGAAFGDRENDGYIDVVAANLGQRAYVLRNSGDHRNHWLGVTVTGRKSNRDGIGCRVKIVSASGMAQYYIW